MFNTSIAGPPRKPMIRSFAAFAIAAIALTFATDAAAIFRCEDKTGRVTYSNLPCPSHARTVRRVDESPPVVVHDGANGSSAADNPAEASPASAVAAAHVQPDRAEASLSERARNPIEEDRRITAQFNAQKRECEQRARQLQFLQEDVRAASPSTRSSAELALRRAQDDYQQRCPRQR